MNQTYRFHAVFGLAVLLCAAPALGRTHATAPHRAAPAPGPAAPASAAAPGAAAPAAPAPTPPAGAALQSDTGPADGVAAIVNDAIITEYDLRQRILLFVSTSGLQPTPQILAKLRGQVLAQLETEQLQIQEARK
ncbi:MAG: hypothetical protein ACXWLQ_06410, partial [Rhizomicrobium sp.]